MVKLPDVTKGKALVVTLASLVGPKVIEYLQDPKRAEQARLWVERLAPSLKPRTPDAKLAAKIGAVRAHLDTVAPDDPWFAQRSGWESRMRALDKKRALVVGAYSGRERARQLKSISRQVDDLLLELLQAADD